MRLQPTLSLGPAHVKSRVAKGVPPSCVFLVRRERPPPGTASLARVKLRLVLPAALLALAAAAPAPALAADPIMPLESVRAGMRCTGLSVVRGTQIARFDVEVLDVIRGDAASAGPRILFRVSGPAVDVTGVGPGFSGSPILCPDANGVQRNAGAISEGLGEYGNKVGLATPIELILGERPETPRGARRAPGLLRRAQRYSTPLTVSGLSGPMRTVLSRAATRAGRPVLAAPSGPFLGFPVQDLRPGAAVSTGLSSGDIGLGAIGTVAYRDGSSVWAFGHPLDGLGARALLLQDAYVYAVVNNPVGVEGASSYKLAVPGHTVGSLTNDTLNAVIGRMGPAPRTIPVKVTVRNAVTGRIRTLRSQVTDERRLDLGTSLELIASLSLGQGLIEALGAEPPGISTSMCLRIRIQERDRPLGFCNDYLEGGGPFDDLSSALLLVDAFKFGKLTPLSVSVSARVRPTVSEALLVRAQTRESARPGERIPVRLSFKLRGGTPFSRTLSYRVPEQTRPGDRVLKLSGVGADSLQGGSEESLFDLFFVDVGGGDEAGPRSVDALAEKIAGFRRREGLHATFASKGRGPVVLPSPRRLLRGKAQVKIRVTG